MSGIQGQTEILIRIPIYYNLNLYQADFFLIAIVVWWYHSKESQLLTPVGFVVHICDTENILFS